MAEFQRNRRLTSPGEFRQLFATGRRLNICGFRIYYLINLPKSRLGLAVSKKVANAVGRNRIKRLIRESFRSAGLNNLDVVVVAHKRAGQMTNPEILKELSTTWAILQKAANNSVSHLSRHTNI